MESDNLINESSIEQGSMLPSGDNNVEKLLDLNEQLRENEKSGNSGDTKDAETEQFDNLPTSEDSIQSKSNNLDSEVAAEAEEAKEEESAKESPLETESEKNAMEVDEPVQNEAMEVDEPKEKEPPLPEATEAATGPEKKEEEDKTAEVENTDVIESESAERSPEAEKKDDDKPSDSEKVDESESSQKTDEFESSKKSDEFESSEKTDEFESSKKSDEFESSEKTDESEVSQKAEESESSQKDSENSIKETESSLKDPEIDQLEKSEERSDKSPDTQKDSEKETESEKDDDPDIGRPQEMEKVDVLNETSQDEPETDKEPEKDPIQLLDSDNLDESKDDEDKDKEGEGGLQEVNISCDENHFESDNDNEDRAEFMEVDINEATNDDKDDDQSPDKDLLDQDPMADNFDADNLGEDREGADAELCIIPDTERVISQAEKEAASSIPPLRDISEASVAEETVEDSQETAAQVEAAATVVNKYEKEDEQKCTQCSTEKKIKYFFTKNDVESYLCGDECLEALKTAQADEKFVMSWEEGSLRVKQFPMKEPTISEPPCDRFCMNCRKLTDDPENNLSWEIMDFCNELCLTKYQREIGSHCFSCKGNVRSNCLGKYCVRFGNDIRQFCTSHCLEDYKKGLKVCSYCQQDMSTGSEGFLAPVGDKGHFKDFCSQLCMEKYDIMTNNRPPKVPEGSKCSVCNDENKAIAIEFENEGVSNFFCSEPCFVAFNFVNNITTGKCSMCRRNFTKKVLDQHIIFYDNSPHRFCSNSCQNIYIIAHRKIVPCSWCKVKKYNFDMIRRYSKSAGLINMCSVNCLNLYNVSLNAVSAKKVSCDYCTKNLYALYHLTMSDATIRNFCSYSCVMSFQNQFQKTRITLEEEPVPASTPRRIPRKSPLVTKEDLPPEPPALPVITNVHSLATPARNGDVSPTVRSRKSTTNNASGTNDVQVQIRQHFIIKPTPLPDQRNVSTMCFVKKANKSVGTKQNMITKEVQTDQEGAEKIIVPIPVPIYVPVPMHMYSVPVPMPVPFPLPIPIPIFIPTTRNSANGIMKEIKKIQVKIPTDPYEAELLMMAEMVAGEKKEEHTDSDSDVDDNQGGDEGNYSPEPVDASNAFGDDMLQMALKMATELDEPAVDLEGALTANTITATQSTETHNEEAIDDPQPMHMMDHHRPSMRGRKRGMRQSRGTGAKRGRRSDHHEIPIMQQPAQPPPPPEPVEKPDANMCLKYTFGVNAWKQWVTTKNAELEKSSRRVKLFKTEILQLTADELNYSLCLFVKEVRKPNGAEYAPDTIYYLCLGIQQYLFENGRIDNIFCDPYYEKFTDCLDEVARKFSVLYTDSHYIVTRVEEEHLWESKQLGAHSPHVLLSTLMFFNTKHFNLTTVDEHMQLSFSHIMKHWKRNPNQPGASKVPGSRNVLLRFYPPQSAIQNNTRKKKVYEQQENEENPLRCPVKLYEFYLSKCPESVKTRNDVFYLQPERSCVPDSPVWYSTMPLPRESLEKMLHRVKMVKEINVALLTT